MYLEQDIFHMTSHHYEEATKLHYNRRKSISTTTILFCSAHLQVESKFITIHPIITSPTRRTLYSYRPQVVCLIYTLNLRTLSAQTFTALYMTTNLICVFCIHYHMNTCIKKLKSPQGLSPKWKCPIYKFYVQKVPGRRGFDGGLSRM